MQFILLRCLALGLSLIATTTTAASATIQTPPMPQGTATVLQPAKPLIPFSLIDTEGKSFTQASLQGQWSLLFFGYADCPGICPTTLKVLQKVWIDPVLDQKLHFLFVSLNPRDDTPAKLKAFLAGFNPHFEGLTGDAKQIQALSKACSIYSWQDPTATPLMIDHSATLLLITPQGAIKALFSPPHEAATLLAELKALIKP
ncbi:MAG: SCO family protein [Gammaproteobacteria bacterium]|nr:SCO family protein [Gammaproteobacteria bacterium]